MTLERCVKSSCMVVEPGYSKQALEQLTAKQVWLDNPMRFDKDVCSTQDAYDLTRHLLAHGLCRTYDAK